MGREATAELVGRADWSGAPPDLLPPRESDDGRPVVAIELTPIGAAAAEWSALRARWLALPPHPYIIDALAPGPNDGVLLRYPAIDWTFEPAQVDRGLALATWGLQIAHALDAVRREVPLDELRRFLRFQVYVDLDGAARLTFLPVDRATAPAELAELGGRADEPLLVALVAEAIAGLAADITDFRGTPLGEIVRRSADPVRRLRPATLAALRQELIGARAHEGRRGPGLVGWRHVEAALGWLAVGAPGRALRAAEAALELGKHLGLAQAVRLVALDRLGLPASEWTPRARTVGERRELANAARAALRRLLGEAGLNAEVRPLPMLLWSEAFAQGAALEAERGFAEAAAVYLRAAESPDRDRALARCFLAMGKTGHAIDYAGRALARDPLLAEPKVIRARARLQRGEPDAALPDVEALLAAQPDDGLAHYLHGRCLFALGRPGEARAAFDRACALAPQLLEAMLLRRQLVRATTRARADAGMSLAQVIALPAHLGDLRGAVAAGDTDALIARLGGAAYADDPEAQLVLGQCLLYAGRAADALAAFARAPALPAARVGEGRALLALGRAAESLAVFDALGAADAAEIAEGRAAALAALGRAEEAAAALAVAERVAL